MKMSFEMKVHSGPKYSDFLVKLDEQLICKTRYAILHHIKLCHVQSEAL